MSGNVSSVPVTAGGASAAPVARVRLVVVVVPATFVPFGKWGDVVIYTHGEQPPLIHAVFTHHAHHHNSAATATPRLTFL